MKLNEDIFEIDIPNVVHDDIEISNLETEIPQPGPEIGISNLITQLINSTYSMIEDYNSLSIALSDNQETEKAQIVSSMISNEHIHIGMLQSLLECFSPNADSIKTGEEIIDGAINESFPVNNGVDLEKVCRQIWKDLDGDVSDKEDWNNWLEIYWDDIRKLTNGESYTKMTVEGDNSKARLNLKTEGRHIVYKFFDEDEYYTAYDVQEIEDAIKRRNLNESLNEDAVNDDFQYKYILRRKVYNALADLCFDFHKRGRDITAKEMDLAYDWFAAQFWNSEDDPSYSDNLTNESLNESFGYCPSFDEWYFQETGVNTSDLDDEQYDDLWNDEYLMNLYHDFCDSYKENLTESKIRPNIVNVQGIYDYVVENGFEKEAKEILDDCKIKVIKGKCTEISANANPGNAYYRLSHLVDSKNESLNESISDKFIDDKIWEIFNACIEHNSEADYDVNKAIEYYFTQQNLPSSGDLETDIDNLSRYDKLNLLDRMMGVAEQYHLLESLNESMTQEQFDERVETVMKPFVADLDAFEDENGDDFYVTWSFGVNDDDKITAGLDIHFDGRFIDEETKDFDEETIKPFLDELESIIDKHGFELDNVNGYDYKVKGPKTSMFTKARHYQIIEK